MQSNRTEGEGEDMRRMKSISLFAVAAMLASATAWGELVHKEETLRGLSGVGVLVEDIKKKAEEKGLTEERVQTTVELELRKVGIKVLSEEQLSNTPGAPYLYINIHAVVRDDGFVLHNISLELKQTVALARDDSTTCIATTWSKGSLGTAGAEKIDQIRSVALVSLLEEFLNDWLAVNPKE